MTQRADLLLELGCEELPARLLDDQVGLLADGIGNGLTEAGLVEANQTIEKLSTPRRLAIRVPAVLDRQPDRVVDRKGPPESAAFDTDGKPTRAAEGFARSVGMNVDELERLETDQGRWLFAQVSQPGQSLTELLPELLDKTIKTMAGARSMRWSDRSERFLRPVRWLLVVHGEEVIDLAAFGLKSGRTTWGHRLHGAGKHEVLAADQYESVLAKACVLVDPAARRERIRTQVARLADELGLCVEIDADLLAENAGLTEWPVAVIGQFDPSFLEVPSEALICSMQQHQKCFPLHQADGRLANHFIAIANIESMDAVAMTHGFERVIRPRLADARFFFEQDRKTSLADRRSRLDEVLFQERLGSVGDKSRRLERLAVELAEAFDANPEQTRRAATLCKCDLVTEMVGEFPELQGTMGRYYALADGEPEGVATAMESHYQPRHAGDDLPADAVGRALAVADRLDTLVGIFAAGKKPKGGKDPFALRRAALGLIRILEESGCDRTVPELVAQAAAVLADQVRVSEDVGSEVIEFIMERLRSHAADGGLETNTVHAVAAGKTGSVADFMARARAIQDFVDDPRAASLIGANKRASNLLRQAEGVAIGDVDDTLFEEEAEKALFDGILQAEEKLQSALTDADYPQSLATLAGLSEAVDAFFDQVMVMTDDAALKINRLGLLQRLKDLIADIADLAKLGR
jgi:glycyl-tRNA synthetase beta chain